MPYFRRRGYSLIELLIVIAIFGITISLVTASYLTFERNTRFKNAALQLKSDIRYAQNLAVTGEKGADSGPICRKDSTHVLGGWYVGLALNSTTYQLSGLCLTLDANGNITNQAVFGSKSINLPKGVSISGLSQGTNIFFQPLGQNVTFTSSSAPIFNADGTFRLPLGSGSPLVVKLQSTSASGTYSLTVQTTGEVNETKCPTTPC